MPEVVEEVHQLKIHQKISNVLNARVLGLSCVGVVVPYNDGILVP